MTVVEFEERAVDDRKGFSGGMERGGVVLEDVLLFLPLLKQFVPKACLGKVRTPRIRCPGVQQRVAAARTTLPE